MTLPGETVGLMGTECIDCETFLPLEVQSSMAGYYLGYFCPNCGPYSRETDYYKTRGAAEAELARWLEDYEQLPEKVRTLDE